MRQFLTDEEYRTYFFVLGGMRKALAEDLARTWGPGPRRILDIASGHGLFGLEVAHATPRAFICLTGLPVDRSTYREVVRSLKDGKLSSLPHLEPSDATRTGFLTADVAKLPFADGTFDGAVNFLGLEDVHMLGGPAAVTCAIREAARVTKVGGWVEVAFQVFGDNAGDALAKQVMASVGHKAIFLGPKAYEDALDRAGVQVLEKKGYSTGRLLTGSQAREELRYACEETMRIYGRYGVRTNPLQDVWNRFGEDIERHGYALYTDVLALVGRRREQRCGRDSCRGE